MKTITIDLENCYGIKKLQTEFHYDPSTESHARLAETLAPWAGGAARALRTRVGSGAFGA